MISESYRNSEEFKFIVSVDQIGMSDEDIVISILETKVKDLKNEMGDLVDDLQERYYPIKYILEEKDYEVKQAKDNLNGWRTFSGVCAFVLVLQSAYYRF